MITHKLCVPFAQLSALQVYHILRLRSEVFVVEQNCVYQDIDNKDVNSECYQLLWYKDESLVAYARLLGAGLSYDDVSIGRVIVAPSARGLGLGRQIIQASLEQIECLWPGLGVTIGAQSHLSQLYQEFGFKEVSAHYPEDGIMHVDMHRASNRPL
jgi:ElaA protein